MPADYRPNWDRLEDEVQVTTFRASGPGGQHRNKTESAVRVTHVPTGVTARASESRSQHRNRIVAMQRLRERLEAKYAEKPPRRPSTVPRREKERRRRQKKQRSLVKALRQAPEPDGE